MLLIAYCFRIYDSVTMVPLPSPAVVAKNKHEELVKVKQEKQLEIKPEDADLEQTVRACKEWMQRNGITDGEATLTNEQPSEGEEAQAAEDLHKKAVREARSQLEAEYKNKLNAAMAAEGRGRGNFVYLQFEDGPIQSWGCT